MSKAIVELTNPGYLLVLGQDAQGFAWPGPPNIPLFIAYQKQKNPSYSLQHYTVSKQYRYGKQIFDLVHMLDNAAKYLKNEATTQTATNGSPLPGDTRYYTNIDAVMRGPYGNVIREAGPNAVIVSDNDKIPALKRQYPHCHILTPLAVAGAQYDIVVIDGVTASAINTIDKNEWNAIPTNTKAYTGPKNKKNDTVIPELQRLMTLVSRATHVCLLSWLSSNNTNVNAKFPPNFKAFQKLLLDLNPTPAECTQIYQPDAPSDAQWTAEIERLIRAGFLDFARDSYNQHIQPKQGISFEEAFASVLTAKPPHHSNLKVAADSSSHIGKSDSQSTENDSPQKESSETSSANKKKKKSECSPQKPADEPKEIKDRRLKVQQLSKEFYAIKNTNISNTLKQSTKQQLHDLFFLRPSINGLSVFEKLINSDAKDQEIIAKNIKALSNVKLISGKFDAGFFLTPMWDLDDKTTPVFAWLATESSKSPLCARAFQDLFTPVMGTSSNTALKETYQKFTQNLLCKEMLINSVAQQWVPQSILSQFICLNINDKLINQAKEQTVFIERVKSIPQPIIEPELRCTIKKLFTESHHALLQKIYELLTTSTPNLCNFFEKELKNILGQKLKNLTTLEASDQWRAFFRATKISLSDIPFSEKSHSNALLEALSRQCSEGFIREILSNSKHIEIRENTFLTQSINTARYTNESSLETTFLSPFMSMVYHYKPAILNLFITQFLCKYSKEQLQALINTCTLDSKKLTALHLASQLPKEKGSIEKINLLMEHGADLQAISCIPEKFLHYSCTSDQTFNAAGIPLFYAIAYDRADNMKVLHDWHEKLSISYQITDLRNQFNWIESVENFLTAPDEIVIPNIAAR
ncbi:MAG: hypothetical protein FJ161_04670, partial [Gammaproteobacteria bacterium]|nr:hypothetical protein [Gammaproteobacteria bacterium]